MSYSRLSLLCILFCFLCVAAIFAVVTAFGVTATPVLAESISPAQWSYRGESGPDNWGGA